VKLLKDLTKKRKADHINICLEENIQARKITTCFEDVYFIHRALPEVDREDINLETKVFGHKLSAPIIVGAMTGGTVKALKINSSIAEAVEELGLGMGVGSQRAAIENPKLEETFSIARKKAPTAFLIANIGAPQLVQNYGLKEVKKAVEMIDADALAVHLNPLQEAIQPEGETKFKGLLEKIGKIVNSLDVPVIVKETGAGIAAEEAIKLEKLGIDGIDVAGAGGTSWAAVEYYRAKKIEDKVLEALGEVFWDWGIPTAISLIEVVQSVTIPVIASGGIRNGAQAAKALALGASLTSISSPILKHAVEGSEKIKQALEQIVEEIRNVMFLVGADSIERLREVPLVITGKTYQWLKIRGFNPEVYVERSIRK